MELEGLTPDALAEILGGTGRAKSVWQSLLRGVDPYEDPRLSPRLRDTLRERTRPTRLVVESRGVAGCGTTKLRFGLVGGKCIETVVIPSRRRTTVCVSTQAGCARRCIFCLTATMGLERNLRSAEIVGQVVYAIREARDNGWAPIRNVVLMGMGEPLDNLGAVRASLAVLCAPLALGLGPAHVTLSTVGTTPQAVLETRDLPVQLAWSLHAVDDTLRRRLVPTARHTTTELRRAFIDRGGSLFIEIVLMEGVNDTPEHADALADFLEPFPDEVRVNLLPMNRGRTGVAPSPESRTGAFRDRLRQRGFFCAIRRPRGQDKDAACGQLVAR